MACRQTSQGNVRQGLWFVFPLETRIIRAWGGAGALERIYVDGEIVSEKRSAGRVSTHSFSIDGENFQISFRTISYVRAHIECVLLKNNEPLMTQHVRCVGGETSARRLLLSVLAGGMTSALVLLFKWPLWTLVLFFPVALFVQAKTRSKGRDYVFSQQSAQQAAPLVQNQSRPPPTFGGKP